MGNFHWVVVTQTTEPVSGQKNTEFFGTLTLYQACLHYYQAYVSV